MKTLLLALLLLSGCKPYTLIDYSILGRESKDYLVTYSCEDSRKTVRYRCPIDYNFTTDCWLINLSPDCDVLRIKRVPPPEPWDRPVPDPLYR